MNYLKLMFLVMFSFPLFPNHPPSLAITESIPSAMVAGSVNAITGDHYISEEEITIQGAFPLKVPRNYISGNGDKIFLGWQLFPHLFAGLYLEYRNEDTAYWKVVVKEPNGSPLEFETQTYRPRHKKPIVLTLKPDTTRKGLTNVGRGTISGQTNLKNIRIEMAHDQTSITAYAPDGTVRYYQAVKVGWDGVPKDYLPGGPDKIFLLQWEQLPNQSKICYGHDKYHRLNVIRTTTPDTRKTFASATINYHSGKLDKNRHFDITTSDGRVLNYRFEAHSDIFFLKNVSTPAYPQEAIIYHEKVRDGAYTWGYLLKHRNISSNRYYNLDYYWEGNNEVSGNKIKVAREDPRWLRVKTLSRPVGEDHSALITHTFFYDTDKRLTSVREIDNILTQYSYTENLRMEQIRYYGPGDQPHHSEKYVWGEEGPLTANLLCHTFLDHQNNPLFSKRFFYDDRGNVQEERLYGNLSGSCTAPLVLGKDGFPQHNGIESYSIKRTYSQDGFNLLKREEEQNGKVTINEYHPNSSILVSRFICDRDHIKIRNFYEYNGDALLVREITDDGYTNDKNNLSGVKTRRIKEYTLIPDGQPYQGMPQVITEKYWDGTSEKLLKRTVLHYTTGGYVDKEDIYDENNKYCFSKTTKYDLAGRVKEETNPLGQASIHDYDPVGNKNYYKDFGGKKEIRMDYDCSNRLKVVDEIGSDKLFHKITHRYNTKHNKIATKDPYGHETTFIPDAFGRITQTHYPPIVSSTGGYLYPIEKQDHDSAGRVIKTMDGRGHETHRKYNARNQVILIEYPDGDSERYHYNLDGALASHTNQENATTSYSYDFLGRKTVETNALGHATIYKYDAFNLVSIQDAEGNITVYSYDGAGRKASEELAGEKTEYTYDPLGRLHCTKRGGSYRITEYDNLDRITEEKDEDSRQNVYKKICYKYDDAGNLSLVTRFIDRKEVQEAFIHDSFNRLIEHKDALGYVTTITYDDKYQNRQGQTVLQKTETDPLGLQTITIYDVLGHVASVEKKNSRNEVLDLEEHFYDENGNLTFHVKNHDHTVAWNYDPMNRVEALMQGGTRSTHFVYTKTGLVKSKRKPDGVTVANRYDPLDQLKETTSTDHTIRYTFEYNRIGQQVLEKDEINGTQTVRRYDPYGKLLGEKLGNGLSLSSEYDEQGRQKRLVLPNGSDVIFHYDSTFLRRIERDQKYHDFDVYDLSGRLIKQTVPGSLGSMTFCYDPVGRKSAQKSPCNMQEAVFDPVGNLSELKTNAESKMYEYDDLYQLTAEKDHTYKYDLHGNKTDKDGEVFIFNHFNEVASHLTYDPNGNPKSDEDKTYTYDAFDRLVAISDPEKVIELRYDYQGRLLSKACNGTSTFYIYDGMKEIGSTDASGTPLELRILNPIYSSERGAAVLLEIDQQSYIPIHDLFGNVIELVGVQNQKVESYQYSAYGEGLQSGINPWQYASKRLHADLGLISFGQRFYNPRHGRWLTQDPAGFVDGYNTYSFVANNPLTNFDHYGLTMTSIVSLIPSIADIEGNTKVSAPVVHAIGDMAIHTGNLCAGTGFILASPWILYQNNFQRQGVEREWGALQETFSHFHQSLDANMQQFVPTNERGSYYNWGRSTTEAVIGGYFLAQAAGSALMRGVDWVVNGIQAYRANRSASVISSNPFPTNSGVNLNYTNEKILFGQKSVSAYFSKKGTFELKPISEVVQGLKNGMISPESLPIEIIVRNGQRITLNNRSLLALRRAGMEPKVIINKTGIEKYELWLNDHLKGNLPSDVIRIRGGAPNTSLIGPTE